MSFVSLLQAQQLVIKKDFTPEKDKITKQYYQADSLINVSANLLLKIDFKNIDMILVYSFYISDIEKILKKINDFELPLKLDLKVSDPLAINSRFIQLFTDLGRYRTINGQMKQDVYYHFYKKAMQFKMDGKYTEALDLFQRSIKAKKNYYPSHIEMALLYNQYGKLADAIRVVENVHNQLKPEGQDLLLFVQLSDSLYFSFLRKAKVQIDMQQFNEALDILSKAKSFSAINWIANKDTVITLITVARQGLFDSYIRIAKKAINLQKYYLAEPLILQADGYAYEYSSYLQNINEVNDLINKLIDGYYKQGKLYRKQGKKIKADEVFTHADALCGRFVKCAKCTDVAEQIKVMHVTPPIVASKPKPIRKDTMPVIVRKESAPVVIQTIQSGNNIYIEKIDSLVRIGGLKAWANEILVAESLLKYAKTIQVDNSIKDSIVIASLVELQTKINNRYCLNARYDYDEWIRKSVSAVKSIQYVDAFEYANKAITSFKKVSFCEQDTMLASKIKTQIKQPVFYCLLINTSLNYLRAKNYKEFMDMYTMAEHVFYQNYIDTYGLNFKSFSKQLISAYDKDAIVFGLQYLLNKNVVNESIQLLQYLQSISYEAELTENQQTQLGQQLALRDKKKDPNASADENVLTYTNNNKWYKVLKQAYLKQFKEKK